MVSQKWNPVNRVPNTNDEIRNKIGTNHKESAELDGFNSEGKVMLTKEEAERIEQALKEEEFRKLFADYITDISDPRYRAEQNEYIRYLEEQNATPEGKKLIYPLPGFVLKLKFVQHGTIKTAWTNTVSASDQDVSLSPQTKKKLFVNIVSSVDVQPPSKKNMRKNCNNGTTWSVPYTLGPLRTEYDKTKQHLVPTFDCCFHPDALTLAKSNVPFRELLVGIARQGALQQLKCSEYYGNDITIDLDFCRILKGTTYVSNEPTVLVVSALAETKPFNEDPKKDETAIEVEAETEPILVSMLDTASSVSSLDNDTSREDIDSDKHEFIIPQYTISERGVFDLSDSDDTKVLCNHHVSTTRPQFLVIRISLPNVSSINELDLEVSEERLVVTSIPVPLSKDIKNKIATSSHSKKRSSTYALTCKFPYPTWSDQGQAEWNKTKHVLIVTLPVKKPECHTIFPKIEDKRCKQSDSVNHQNCEKEANSHSQPYPRSDVIMHNSDTKPINDEVRDSRCSRTNHSRWIDKDYSTFKFDDELQEGSYKNGRGTETTPDSQGSSKMKELPKEYSVVHKKTMRKDSPPSPPKCNVDSVCKASQPETAQTTTYDAGEAKITTSTSDSCTEFISSSVFSGTRQGYIFMNGSQGIGYYQDDHSCQHKSEEFLDVVSGQTCGSNSTFQSLAIQID